ncbi:MAG: hypothetical protein LBM78_00695, partial [Clostridiales bacterium]|nr:hypothetical protein [Clostridiales bacterium]
MPIHHHKGQIIGIPRDVEELYDRAYDAAEEEDYFTALRLCRRAIEIEYWFIDPHILFGEVCGMLGESGLALQTYLRVLALDPTATECYGYMARCYYELDNVRGAIDAMRMCADTLDEEEAADVRALVDEMSTSVPAARVDEVSDMRALLDEMTAHISALPRMVEAESATDRLVREARVLEEAGKYEDAYGLLCDVRTPVSPKQELLIRELRLQCVMCAGKTEKEEAEAQRILELAPDNGMALCAMVGVHRRKKAKDALEAVLDAIESVQTAALPDGLSNVALLCECGRLAAAKRAALHVLSQHPGDEETLYALAQVYYYLGEVQNAQETLVTILTLNPYHYPARWLNTLCHDKPGGKRAKDTDIYFDDVPPRARKEVERWLVSLSRQPAETFITSTPTFFAAMWWYYHSEVCNPRVCCDLHRN